MTWVKSRYSWSREILENNINEEIVRKIREIVEPYFDNFYESKDDEVNIEKEVKEKVKGIIPRFGDLMHSVVVHVFAHLNKPEGCYKCPYFLRKLEVSICLRDHAIFATICKDIIFEYKLNHVVVTIE